MSRQKRFLILIISLITMMGLLTGCGIIPTAIVDEVDPSVYSGQPTTRQLPDMGTFFARQRNATRSLEKDDGFQKVYIDNETDQALVLEYINLLTSDTYGFQICNDFDLSLEDPFNGEFNEKWSVAFESTRMDAGKRITNNINNIPCDAFLFHSGNELTLRYSDVFSIHDFGDRYSGAPADTFQDFTGKSAGSFVDFMGSYHTGDEKLSVKSNVRESYKYVKNYQSYEAFKGTATILYNGSEPLTGKAFLRVDNRKDSDSYSVEAAFITVEDFLDSANGEEINLVLPVVNEEGIAYRFSDFFSNHQGYKEKSCFYFYHTPSEMKDSIYCTFLRDIVSYIESLTVRVIKWDATGEEDCVVYLHSLMYQDGEPIEIDCLISGRLNRIDNMEEYQEASESKSSGGSGFSIFDDDDDDDGPYIPDHAKLDCLTCRGDGDCNTCNGYGEWRRYNSVVSTCNSCNGSGNCRSCGGSGKR